MITNDQLIITDDAGYLIPGTRYVSGVLNRDGVPGGGQVAVIDRDTIALIGSKCASPSGVYRIDIISSGLLVMVIGRDYTPVVVGAYAADSITPQSV